MNLQEIYQNQLNKLRENPNLLDDLSIKSSKNNNYNQIARNKVLIALYNDIKTSVLMGDIVFSLWGLGPRAAAAAADACRGTQFATDRICILRDL